MIEIKNVSKSYKKGKKVIDDLNLKINNGEIFGFIGLNGAGKTTLAVMMCGFIPSFYKGTLSGELRIKGKNILEYKKGEISLFR